MADTLHQSLEVLGHELIEGTAEHGGYMLNEKDPGLLTSLDKLSASAASAVAPGGGASIAAHLEHVRYGLSLMNRWRKGEKNPWMTADWTAAWKRTRVSDAEWADLRKAFASEARQWLENIRTPREYTLVELNGVIGTVSHLAYHFGAIRQIDRAMRGPSAEGS